jgi:Imidazoleglycerol-phosphate synthase
MTKRTTPRRERKRRKVIKGIRREGVRVVGDPVEKIIKYYKDGAEEMNMKKSTLPPMKENMISTV